MSLITEMQRSSLIGRDEGRLISVWVEDQLYLRLLRRFLQPLQRQLVAPEVDAALLFELVGKIVDDSRIEIFAAEEGVAVDRLHLEHAVADLEHRDVERAAAEVIDRDGLLLLVEAIGERRRCRLVDDAQNLEAGDLAGILGRLPLAVVEIGGNGDHRLGDRLAEIALRRLLHLDQRGPRSARVHVLAARLDPGVAVVGADDLVGNELLSFSTIGSS